MNPSSPIPQVVITGVGGYGRLHLENARRLEAEGLLHIAGVVDPAVAAVRDHDGEVPVHADLSAALAAAPADIVIVATPLDTHADLAEEAMLAGADVLLEKPPVPTMADFERLLAVQRETGRTVQVGFQSLGSEAVQAFADDALGLGSTVAVSATGLWSRPLKYWKRARWAGRRMLDGHAVVDGVATNPLAHAVATALRIAGYDTAQSVERVDVDLYRANAIEADDTSVIRVSGPGRPTVTCALTLCAPPSYVAAADRGASVTVDGEQASAAFSYTTDVVTIDGADRTFGRADLLRNLVEHRRTGVDLIVPLESTGAFMRVVEAIRIAPDPTKVDPGAVVWHGEGADAYPVIDGIVDTVREAAWTGSTFTELGAGWAVRAVDGVLAEARVGGTVVAGAPENGTLVAQLLDGTATIPFSSPHPYLHPVRTLGGVTVTATHPADHDWHTGVGFTVQDAAGVNFWGGRTYVRDSGYESLDDHGRIEVEGTDARADGTTLALAWIGPDGSPVLREQRTLDWHPIDADGTAAWALDLDVRLSPAARGGVTLGSPGSKGRVGAGYGGFFWRLPECSDVEVFTADASGEDAVNGSVAPWLAWSARLVGEAGRSGEASIVLASGDPVTASDPWFVRVRDYPGLGSSVAWDAPIPVPASGLARSYRAAVVDGRVSAHTASAIARAIASSDGSER
ncbi:MAG TPA: DUF6807 family protein [Humibacter sp.]|nr:DUF6807 family protein [Humibacter sp.]